MNELRAATLREGFSLVEAVVATLLLTIIVTGLAAHLYGVARKGLVVANNSYRHAVVTQELGRLTVMPYSELKDEDLPPITDSPYPHQKSVRVIPLPDGSAKEVRLIIEQTVPVPRTDTLRLIRARPVTGNPFNTK
jgi:hypothetical protein